MLYEKTYKDNFSFWKNWERYLKNLDENKIHEATSCIENFFWDKDIIKWKYIIDFWCWSWLMSYAFVKLWAKKVISIDIDDYSLKCAISLKEKFNIADDKWIIKKWSVLDETFIKSLWEVDILYSWWVIHHTWDMWKWLNLVDSLVKKWWYFYLAIYNDSNIILEWTSKFWLKIKKIYSKNSFLKYIIKPIYIIYYMLWLLVHFKNPISYIKNYSSVRGMSFFIDIEDWLWWYPYEYASFDEINNFYLKKDYKLQISKKVRSIWCNEFLFQKKV